MDSAGHFSFINDGLTVEAMRAQKNLCGATTLSRDHLSYETSYISAPTMLLHTFQPQLEDNLSIRTARAQSLHAPIIGPTDTPTPTQTKYKQRVVCCANLTPRNAS